MARGTRTPVAPAFGRRVDRVREANTSTPETRACSCSPPSRDPHRAKRGDRRTRGQQLTITAHENNCLLISCPLLAGEAQRDSNNECLLNS
jgi:hypothetical protein